MLPAVVAQARYVGWRYVHGERFSRGQSPTRSVLRGKQPLLDVHPCLILLRSGENSLFIDHYPLFCFNNQLAKGIPNPAQHGEGFCAVVDYIQPVTLSVIACSNPFVLTEFDIANRRTSLDLDSQFLTRWATCQWIEACPF